DRQEFPELPTELRDLPDREGVVELNTVIARACRHNPEDRYKTVNEMRVDLELLQSGKSLARLRRAEARFRNALRIGVVLSALTLVASIGLIIERSQTRKARELAAQNSRLAAEKARLSEESREHLVQASINNGFRLLDNGDPSGALVWFAAALP